MRRVELMKQRHDLKEAMRRTKNAVDKMDLPNEDDFSAARFRAKVKARLNRNLKKSYLKKSLRRSFPDPCCPDPNKWYTFSDPNCYNQLDEVVVTGTRAKNQNLPKLKPQDSPSAFSSYMDSIDWWDGSIKDPWPDSKWSWFEDRQGGDQVWGSIGGGDTGRKLGKNGKLYNSYQGDDLVPWGGGAKLKFWAQELNRLSFLLLGLKDGGKTIRHGHNLNSLNNDEKKIQKDTIVNAKAFEVLMIHMDTKSFSTSEKDIIFSGNVEKVLRELDSLERKNQQERWYRDNWFKE